jgi:hypothetical protein
VVPLFLDRLEKSGPDKVLKKRIEKLRKLRL